MGRKEGFPSLPWLSRAMGSLTGSAALLGSFSGRTAYLYSFSSLCWHSKQSRSLYIAAI